MECLFKALSMFILNKNPSGFFYVRDIGKFINKTQSRAFKIQWRDRLL